MPTAWLGTLLHWGPQLHFSTSWVLPRLVDGVRVGASTSPVVVHLRDADGGPGASSRTPWACSGGSGGAVRYSRAGGKGVWLVGGVVWVVWQKTQP